VEHEPYQGAWVKHRRKQLKRTQGQLAVAFSEAVAPLSRSHLANIEAGTYAPSPDLIKFIATLCGLDLPATWQQVGTLAQTKHERGPTLHQLSHVADPGPTPPAGIPDAPAPPGPHASPTELLDWARNKLASLASGPPDQIVLTTAGPLADALHAAPPPGGKLGGILGSGIRAVLEKGADLHHLLAVPDDPEAHFEVLAQALPLAARYCPPASSSRPHLSRYSLTLVPDSPAGPDLVASSRTSRASLIMPIIRDGQPGVAVAEMAPSAGLPDAGPGQTWASDYAAWLAARGTDLFSWVTVVEAGTLNLPAGPWEELLTAAWKQPGGRDSIQRMLPLNTMSDGLRAQLVASQALRRGQPPGSARTKEEVDRRLSMYQDRRNAMLRNLRNEYSYRNVVTREALADLVQHGQYTMERVRGNVLTAEQTASYLQDTIDLIRSYDTFEVLILTDEQLEQALPLGGSWIVKRSPRNQAASTERAWAFLPYESGGRPMAMNVVVSDKLAIEAIGSRIDALWASWVKDKKAADIRQDTIAELEQAQRDIARHR
jgi:transcriptional regulator with XRE-family HTH domain